MCPKHLLKKERRVWIQSSGTALLAPHFYHLQPLTMATNTTTATDTTKKRFRQKFANLLTPGDLQTTYGKKFPFTKHS
ncbi:hypothetical protein ACTXT7_001221 [Hymenolepis weldensis]